MQALYQVASELRVITKMSFLGRFILSFTSTILSEIHGMRVLRLSKTKLATIHRHPEKGTEKV